ncbi:MAG: FCD domain-containing protein [Fuscovulum sp.]|jgi:GntR family carbon starvation induced transcriptional regulator|nr:FCD domain-containing protein [Fuscovulum sp.]
MTLAEKAYASLRHDIVHGRFQPGSPLRLADLGERYGMGFSPLREALNRLQAERLVTAETQRGFRVAPLSAAEFEDALSARLVIEGTALRRAIQLGDDAWAAAIVAALYALKVQADRPNADGRELQLRHHAFHRALLAGCGSDWLLEFFERLYTATERYRIPALLAGGTQKRDINAEHAAIAEAVLARDADRAEALLRDHYLRTAEVIRSGMPETLAAS